MSVIITAPSQKPGKHISNVITILKNKIKKETSSDPTKLALSITPQKITHGNTAKGREKRQASSSGSLSLDGVREELVSSPSVLKQDSALEKLDLEEALKVADEYKKICTQYQEDIDKLERFGTQKMAKTKYLLLVKKLELAEKENALKEASRQMESLKLENTRLRHYEELANLQVLVGDDNKDVTSRLIEAEKRLVEVERDCAHLSIALEDEKSSNAALHVELAQLRDALEAEQTRNADLSISLDRKRVEEDETLLCNAPQVNLQVEREQESIELHKEITAMEEKLADKDSDIEKMKIDTEELSKRIQDLEIVEHDKQEAANLEQELRNNISELEEQVVEKNKDIRMLQHELRDMKKILRRELRLPAQTVDGTGTTAAAVLTPSSSTHMQHKQHRLSTDEDDVNFKYLKHVLFKFLTSSDSEARPLTSAVATLLRCSPEEECLLRDTLEWKTSWFGTRPNLGFDHTAKTIPPTSQHSIPFVFAF
jgi:golgin subfamily A protein 1